MDGLPLGYCSQRRKSWPERKLPCLVMVPIGWTCDGAALERFERHASEIQFAARAAAGRWGSYLPSSEHADAIQVALVSALRWLGSYDGERPLKPYLMTVMRTGLIAEGARLRSVDRFARGAVELREPRALEVQVSSAGAVPVEMVERGWAEGAMMDALSERSKLVFERLVRPSPELLVATRNTAGRMNRRPSVRVIAEDLDCTARAVEKSITEIRRMMGGLRLCPRASKPARARETGDS